MDNIDIRGKFPKVYDGFVEIDKLSEAEQKVFEQFKDEILQLVSNQWIMTATSEGLTEYEEMYHITSLPTDSIEFRRERLINRLSAAPAYTYRHLMQRLRSFLGQANPLVVLQPNAYLITFYLLIGEYGKLHELIQTLVETIPANMEMRINNGIVTDPTTTYRIGQVVDTYQEYTLL